MSVNGGMEKRCFRCGEWGHIQRQCNASAAGAGQGSSGTGAQDAMMKMMAELIAEMRAARTGNASATSKK